jgi:hypothetical protein
MAGAIRDLSRAELSRQTDDKRSDTSFTACEIPNAASVFVIGTLRRMAIEGNRSVTGHPRAETSDPNRAYALRFEWNAVASSVHERIWELANPPNAQRRGRCLKSDYGNQRVRVAASMASAGCQAGGPIIRPRPRWGNNNEMRGLGAAIHANECPIAGPRSWLSRPVKTCRIDHNIVFL